MHKKFQAFIKKLNIFSLATYVSPYHNHMVFILEYGGAGL